MKIDQFSLFPTKLITIQFEDTAGLNGSLARLFESHDELSPGFNMHPNALNLLHLAEVEPAIASLRDMFKLGIQHWLQSEKIAFPEHADLVLFSNYARCGEYTLVHNHNADLVGVYYAQTAEHCRAPVEDSGENTDYFAAEDGLLVLHDPRFNANLAAVGVRDHVKIYPQPGLMLIFPAYLWHSVLPNTGPLHRLSFSMNIRLGWGGESSAERTTLA